MISSDTGLSISVKSREAQVMKPEPVDENFVWPEMVRCSVQMCLKINGYDTGQIWMKIV